MIKKIDIFIIIINIIFFAYYATQLLVFTDEFAINNLGFFNHAIAGLSEIIGIIFTTFIIALLIIVFRGLEKQLPLISVITLFQILVAFNFWRYVLTDSPGETNLNIVIVNAVVFSTISCLNLILISKNINKI